MIAPRFVDVESQACPAHLHLLPLRTAALPTWAVFGLVAQRQNRGQGRQVCHHVLHHSILLNGLRRLLSVLKLSLSLRLVSYLIAWYWHLLILN